MLGHISSVLRGKCYSADQLTRYWLHSISMHCGRYERKFRGRTGHFPDYRNPRTLTEKLAWMRLHDHNPIYPTLVDKIAVRDYVRERVGEGVLIPLYGTWEDARDIDFDSLPPSFILKCNHESGFVVICHDRESLDQTYVRAQLATRLRMNFYNRNHEWPYLGVKPRILAEKLLKNEDGSEPYDYKIHCFDGKPEFTIVVKDRHTRQVQGCYSPEWETMPFTATLTPAVEIERPRTLERMLEVAATLSEGLRCCRVDLYSVREDVYFGELTLIIGGGLLNYYPSSYDLYWGSHLKLPTVNEQDSDPEAYI